MPLNRPTLAQLISRTVADIQSRLPGSNPLKQKSWLGAVGYALSYGLHGLYGQLQYEGVQSNPGTAYGDRLTYWASLWLDVPRLPASAARGSIDLSGTPGTVIAQGLRLQSAAGNEYITDGDVTLDASGAGSVAVVSSNAGADQNLPVASLLTLINPMANVNAQTEVAVGGMAGGTDVEDDARVLKRLKQRIQFPPHGGAWFDYQRWALEVPGVDRVWVAPLYSGDGTVQVWIGEADYDGTDQLASGALVDQVQTYITDRSRAPVTAMVTVAAPTLQPVDIDIQINPQTPSVYAAVRAELVQLFERDAEPEGVILISRLRESVSIAAGESDNVITTPTVNVQAGADEIPVLGNVTFASNG